MAKRCQFTKVSYSQESYNNISTPKLMDKQSPVNKLFCLFCAVGPIIKLPSLLM